MIRPVGTPLAGAAVTVMRGSSQVAAGKTDAAGIFRVPLSPGEYAVKAFAEGFAPAGTVAAVGERDVNVELKLGPTGGSADESKTERRTPDSSASSKSGGASSRGRNPAKGDNIPDQRPSRTWYIVEHRANSQAPWVRLGQYSSEREAQAALFRAVERGQISGGAPAESRIRTIQVPVDPGEDRQDRRRP
jgi:hypothetical protein